MKSQWYVKNRAFHIAPRYKCVCVRACVHVCIPMYVYVIIWPKCPKRIFLEHFNLSIKIKLFTIFALSAGFLLTKKSTLEIQVKRNP